MEGLRTNIKMLNTLISKIKNSAKARNFLKWLKISVITANRKMIESLKKREKPKSSKPINIIICGLVRVPKLFKKSLKDFIKLRREGFVDKIIYSAWKGEVDKYLGVKSFVKDNNITLIENEEPKEWGKGSIWCQMKSFDMGLRQLDDDCFVLRTRPDLWININFLRRLFNSREKLQIKSSVTKKIFKHKIWTPYYEITKPFYLAGDCFYGYIDDVRKLVNYDKFYDDFDIGPGITHIRQFIHPFLEDFSVLREYLKKGANTAHSTPQRFEVLNKNLKNNNYLCYLATYYKILNTYFYINSSGVIGQIKLGGRTFCCWTDVVPRRLDNKCLKKSMREDKVWFKKFGQIYAYDEKLLKNICDKKIDNCELCSRMKKIIDKVKI